MIFACHFIDNGSGTDPGYVALVDISKLSQNLQDALIAGDITVPCHAADDETWDDYSGAFKAILNAIVVKLPAVVENIRTIYFSD